MRCRRKSVFLGQSGGRWRGGASLPGRFWKVPGKGTAGVDDYALSLMAGSLPQGCWHRWPPLQGGRGGTWTSPFRTPPKVEKAPQPLGGEAFCSLAFRARVSAVLCSTRPPPPQKNNHAQAPVMGSRRRRRIGGGGWGGG